MENTEEILVIILSITLAIFLVLAIIATRKLIEILNHLKSIAEKADNLATSAEQVGELFKNAAGPVAIGKLFSGIANTVFKDRKSKGEE